MTLSIIFAIALAVCFLSAAVFLFLAITSWYLEEIVAAITVVSGLLSAATVVGILGYAMLRAIVD